MTVTIRIDHPLDGFTLDIGFRMAGTGVTALFGPSGAGKTTCMMAIAGLIRPRRGILRLGETVLMDVENGIFVPPHKRRIGCVFQDARLFPHLSVEGNLRYGAKRAPERPGDGEMAMIIDMLGLGSLLKRRPVSLSGGERQRVALGRTLLAKPRLMLLDEPLAALDQGRKSEILPYLERLRDEMRIPMLYVSHSIDEVARLADDMVLLNKGRIAAHDRMERIMARLDLFPLTGRFEAGAVLMTEVTRQDPDMAMTELAFDGGVLRVPGVTLEPGRKARVRVRARDVMLALERPSLISANNILKGEISDIREEEGAYLDVQVKIGGSYLLARITRLSRSRLGGLPVGTKVYAIIKSVSVERHGASGPRMPPDA